jgi:uncharacterized membrane protein (UPF0127 family)
MSHFISIHNNNNNSIPAIRGKYCNDFLSKLQGFTFRRQLQTNEGLVLVESSDSRVNTAIHMFFVWTDLAVFWVDSSFTVVDKVFAKSWRPFYASHTPASYVIEIHPTRLDDFKLGDKVKFENA